MTIRIKTTGMPSNRENADRESCLRLQNQACDRIMTWLKANATPPRAFRGVFFRPLLPAFRRIIESAHRGHRDMAFHRCRHHL